MIINFEDYNKFQTVENNLDSIEESLLSLILNMHSAGSGVITPARKYRIQNDDGTVTHNVVQKAKINWVPTKTLVTALIVSGLIISWNQIVLNIRRKEQQKRDVNDLEQLQQLEKQIKELKEKKTSVENSAKEKYKSSSKEKINSVKTKYSKELDSLNESFDNLIEELQISNMSGNDPGTGYVDDKGNLNPHWLDKGKILTAIGIVIAVRLAMILVVKKLLRIIQRKHYIEQLVKRELDPVKKRRLREELSELSKEELDAYKYKSDYQDKIDKALSKLDQSEVAQINKKTKVDHYNRELKKVELQLRELKSKKV